jgi:hypothetical protein
VLIIRTVAIRDHTCLGLERVLALRMRDARW